MYVVQRLFQCGEGGGVYSVMHEPDRVGFMKRVLCIAKRGVQDQDGQRRWCVCGNTTCPLIFQSCRD